MSSGDIVCIFWLLGLKKSPFVQKCTEGVCRRPSVADGFRDVNVVDMRSGHRSVYFRDLSSAAVRSPVIVILPDLVLTFHCNF